MFAECTIATHKHGRGERVNALYILHFNYEVRIRYDSRYPTGVIVGKIHDRIRERAKTKRFRGRNAGNKLSAAFIFFDTGPN